MGSTFKQSTSFQPVVTFVGFIALGVIIAVYINTNPSYRLPIILAGFLVGFTIAGAELRSIVNKSKNVEETDQDNLSRDDKVARYVAELFDEDIPFDDSTLDKDPNEES